MPDDHDNLPPAPEENEDRGESPEDSDDVATAADGGGGDGGAGGLSLPAHPADDSDGLRQLMAKHFIEYASYVIKDRAIPDVDDGMKPVQRRILHSLHVMDDGRFHKVANVIGHSMQYHPHGDASIGGALVVLAAKDYFIDRQGNFGNILTGDPASAARYIECRLTPLAREVLFNPEITEFVDSYDSRNREPVTLPAKVPALLMMGAEGIAVGMTTRVLPHNFNELLKAQIAILRQRPFKLYPDFQQGGLMDVSEYDDGRGRVVLRAKIEVDSDKRLVIREVPATTTTESLMASIEDAARRNKIKIAGFNDYTAGNVEIEVLLPRGVHADEAIKQLYAYTDCQVAVNSTIMVIRDNTPVEMTVSEVLHRNTEKLLDYLRRELEIELGKLQERFHEKTLVQLFIEHRIYKRIEEAETIEAVMGEVRRGLVPFRDQLRRDITDEDIEKLLQIQIRRISRFDIDRNREDIEKILQGMDEARNRLAHLVDFTVAYIESLLTRFGKAFPRRTRITNLEQVDAREVALRNLRVGHDRANQFVGSDVRNSSRNDQPLLCSEFDRLLLLRNDGVFFVIAVPQKLYVGPVKYLLRADREQIYSILYRDRRNGTLYAKRFRVDRYIMEKEYASLPKNCLIEALYTNRGVVVDLVLKANARRKLDSLRVAFDEIELRASTARGFKASTYPVESVTLVDRGTPQTNEPTEPTEPTGPAGPDEPGEPGTPGNPDEPTEATDANGPTGERSQTDQTDQPGLTGQAAPPNADSDAAPATAATKARRGRKAAAVKEPESPTAATVPPETPAPPAAHSDAAPAAEAPKARRGRKAAAVKEPESPTAATAPPETPAPPAADSDAAPAAEAPKARRARKAAAVKELESPTAATAPPETPAPPAADSDAAPAAEAPKARRARKAAAVKEPESPTAATAPPETPAGNATDSRPPPASGEPRRGRSAATARPRPPDPRRKHIDEETPFFLE